MGIYATLAAAGARRRRCARGAGGERAESDNAHLFASDCGSAPPLKAELSIV